jgi:exodeoxyribonuclease VII large subunit
VSGEQAQRGPRDRAGRDDERSPRDPERPWNDWLLPTWDDTGSAVEAPVGAASPPEPDWPAYGVPETGRPPGSPESAGNPAPTIPVSRLGPRIRSVGEVTREVRDRLRGSAELRDLWVEGEVGQVSLSAAGHCYFTLKDERAQLSCVIFRDERRQTPFEPRTGLRIVAHGRVDVFEQQGHYQLYVDSLQPAGLGDLALRLEASKARLAAEGLFEAARKRPLPAWPQRVGVVTSAQGAVLHDIRRVLQRRWPLVRVVLAPCLVQGDGAPASILAALRRAARWREADAGVDLVILARGGGSLEDLWAFNDERVVRAVAAFPVPVVVGVGHETDVTLVEFAADVRAATPSVAAELAVPSRPEQVAALHTLRGRLDTAALRALRGATDGLAAERRGLDRLRPAAVLAAEREKVGLLLERAARATLGALAEDRRALARAAERLPLLTRARLVRAATDLRAAQTGLVALSPYATLERGYALVRRADGSVVREAAAQAAGDMLDVRLARGSLDVRVERVRDSDA